MDIHRFDMDRGRHAVASAMVPFTKRLDDATIRDAFDAAYKLKLPEDLLNVLRTVQRDTGGNVDSTLPVGVREWVTAERLFALAWSRGLSSPDALPMFHDQLLDMKTGMCPQGRVTRMLQLAAAYE